MGGFMGARQTWEGNWRGRLLSRLSSLGFHSVHAFLQAFPRETYVQLAGRVGDDIAPIQVECVQFDEAALAGSIRQAARDSLTRDLLYQLKRGWEGGVKGNFATSAAYVDWLGRLEGSSRNQQPNRDFRRKGEIVWAALEQLQPPLGWLPIGIDDPYIAAAFAKGWPE